ncbi:MAG: DNA-binding transcription factor [Chrysothrix sp. TS-e1954]|nr:MAG: DNA-binding transcription factor [Chrysothrix sp. TS-e1954]
MDAQQRRGRSPSTGRQNDLSHSRSTSAHDGFNSQANARGLDPLLLQQSGGAYGNAIDTRSLVNQSSFSGDPNYLGTDFPQQFPQQQQQDLSFLQTHSNDQPYQQNTSQHHQEAQHSPADLSGFGEDHILDASVDPHFLNSVNSGSDQQELNSFLYNQAAAGAQQGTSPSSGFPKDMSQMHQSPGGSNYFNDSNVSHSPNSNHQIQMQQGNWGQQSGHARNTSLDPSSAAYQQPGHMNEWGNMYRGHQRQPSDFSDVSSSAHPSPFLPKADDFEPSNGNSPLFPPSVQDPGMLSDFGQFSLSDGHLQQQQQLSQHHPSHISPGHSPHISPNISPNRASPSSSFHDPNMQIINNMNDQYLGGEPGPEMFGDQSVPGFTSMQQPSAQDSGDLMSPPEISIEPPQDKQPQSNETRESSFHDDDALSPPARSMSTLPICGKLSERPDSPPNLSADHPVTDQRRPRAVSDPFIQPSQGSRSNTPNRSRAGSVGLSPASPRSASRSPSPSASAGITKPRDRASSTSSIPHDNRWLLGLSDPNAPVFNSSRSTSPAPGQQEQVSSQPSPSNSATSDNTPSTGGGAKRAQKHPATFQCHLCPKRFTRAYNLRSHLRTHTDERPFVCTICGKAFARQHDRKRHEGLHSGEKKFICRGLLASARNGESGTQATWGCGRRFARADALGRHFRSEAGRGCIKPLLEEEERERQAARMEQASYDMMAQQQASFQHHQAAAHAQTQSLQVPGTAPPPSQPIGIGTGQGMTLPAALLAQYPALAGIQWDNIGSSPGSNAGLSGGEGGLSGEEGDWGDMDDFGDMGGRSSFEASSGGEFDFEEEGAYEDLGGANPNMVGMGGGMPMNMGMPAQHGQPQGWGGA